MLCMVTLNGCNSDGPDTEEVPVEVTVESKLVSNPAGYASGLYMKVTFEQTGALRYILPDDILGFNYAEGYTYRLKIKEMHVAGTNSVYYTLIEVLSKTPVNNPDIPITPQG